MNGPAIYNAKIKEAALKLARLAGIEAAANAIRGAADTTEATVRLQALAEEPFPSREGRP